MAIAAALIPPETKLTSSPRAEEAKKGNTPQHTPHSLSSLCLNLMFEFPDDEMYRKHYQEALYTMLQYPSGKKLLNYIFQKKPNIKIKIIPLKEWQVGKGNGKWMISTPPSAYAPGDLPQKMFQKIIVNGKVVVEEFPQTLIDVKYSSIYMMHELVHIRHDIEGTRVRNAARAGERIGFESLEEELAVKEENGLREEMGYPLRCHHEIARDPDALPEVSKENIKKSDLRDLELAADQIDIRTSRGEFMKNFAVARLIHLSADVGDLELFKRLLIKYDLKDKPEFITSLPLFKTAASEEVLDYCRSQWSQNSYFINV